MNVELFSSEILSILPYVFVGVFLMTICYCFIDLVVFDESRLKSAGDQPIKETKSRNESNRRVLVAANRYKNGIVLIGLRHWDEHMYAQANAYLAQGIFPKDEVPTQGFLDTKGRFLTRNQAWVLASNAQQITRVPGDKTGQLCSENIY
jgi:hypothetical protein